MLEIHIRLLKTQQEGLFLRIFVTVVATTAGTDVKNFFPFNDSPLRYVVHSIFPLEKKTSTPSFLTYKFKMCEK